MRLKPVCLCRTVRMYYVGTVTSWPYHVFKCPVCGRNKWFSGVTGRLFYDGHGSPL